MSEPIGERTIGAVIRTHAADRPDTAAIVGSHFAPLSYRDLQDQIEDVGAKLRAAGFDRNARIAVAIANPAQATLAIVAISCSATAVPIDPKLTIPEVNRCLQILRPDAVLVLRDTASATRTIAGERGVPIIEANVTQPGRLPLTLAAPKIGSPFPPEEPDAQTPLFILHTSGTTADPNLVPFSHRNMLAVVERLQTWFGLTPQDRCLTVSPVYYSHALTTTVLPPLLTGGSTAFPANATHVEPSEWFVDLKPTWYSAGPTLHLAVLEKMRERADARSMHSLRFLSSAGAPLAADMGARLQDVLGVPVLEHYGSSETAQIATNRPPPGRAKAGTVGIPWPGIVSIVDDDGRQLAAGERGEILVRGPSVTAGYLNAAELNLSAFIDGAYRTGDIGSIDADGFLRLHGRLKEIINRGGEKIAPLEIDRALLQHPDVAQAAAYAVPHPRLGEDVAAAVILRPDASVTPDALREFLFDRLAAFKIPRRIVVTDQLPKGISGKVQRRRLSEMMNGSLQGPVPVESRLHSDLVQIWKRVLKIDAISVDDDFFEKGGDSLLAMDVSVELERLTGKAQPEAILFDAPTIRELAKLLAGEVSNRA